MRSSLSFAALIFVSQFLISHSSAQLSTHDLPSSSVPTKYLTPGQIDRWLFNGKKDEVMVVNLTTTQFDAIIGMASVVEKKGEEDSPKNDKVLYEIDDAGSGGQFKFRLPEDGRFAIRVNGYKMQGGGNYQLRVRRFTPRKIELGKTLKGDVGNRQDMSFFFNAELGEQLVIDSSVGSNHEILDPKGNLVAYKWKSTFMAPSSGEYLFVLKNSRQRSYTLTIRETIVEGLDISSPIQMDNEDRNLYRCQINALPGQFRLLKVKRQASVSSRLIFVPPEDDLGNRLATKSGRSTIQYLPVNPKGEFDLYAVVFGRKGLYELQVYAEGKSKVNVQMINPTRPLADAGNETTSLKIGSTDYYGFEAKAGQLIKASLNSKYFDCELKLYDQYGAEIKSNDDLMDSTNSGITHMVTRNGTYRWHVSSLGNGGGGEYALITESVPMKPIQVGQTVKGKLEKGKVEYWSLDGKAGQKLFINIASDDFYSNVAIYDPKGRYLGADSGHGVGSNGLLAIELKKTGQHTIWVSTHSNDSGVYKMRIFDAKWDE